MNLGLFLKEEQYQTTIYLNDRAYEVLDIGEGKCLIVVATSISDYIEQNREQIVNQRVIVVDISQVLDESKGDMERLERNLVNDLHLSFDVFWLEEVKVTSEVGVINMDGINKVASIRNYSSSQLTKS